MDYGNSEKARNFIDEMLGAIHVDDPATRMLIEQLAVLQDQYDECVETLRQDGQFLNDRFGKPKVHPAAKLQKDIENEYGKKYRLLGLDQQHDPQIGLPFVVPKPIKNASH